MLLIISDTRFSVGQVAEGKRYHAAPCVWVKKVASLTQAIFRRCQNSLCLLICICITVVSASLMFSSVFSIRGNRSIIFCLLIRILLLGGRGARQRERAGHRGLQPGAGPT